MTCSTGTNNTRIDTVVKAYQAMSLTQQAMVDRWIRSCIRPSTRPNTLYSSAELAGYFRYSRSAFAISEDQMKGALHQSGYDATDVFMLNWSYSIDVDQEWIDQHLRQS